MRIFITGATGYLGQEVLKALVSRNHDLTALVRSVKRASTFPQSVNLVPGSIEDVDSYKVALKGQDAFVHLAALVKMWMRDRSQFDKVNVQSLESAIYASSEAGIPKFVYASSFIALGPSNGNPIKENDPRRTNHFHNDYERTKYLADQLARRMIEDGHPVYVLYPGVIYGPGNLTTGNIIAKNLIPFLKGTMPFGLAIKDWSYAFIEDVVKGFISVIEGPPASRRYILGGENHSGKSFYQRLQEATGKKPPVLNLPMSMASLAGYSEYILAVLFGREPSLLTQEVARIYRHSWAYDSSLAQEELNYKITPLQEGLRRMYVWLKDSGYVR